MKTRHIAFAIAFCFVTFLSANAQLLYKVSGAGLDKPSYLFGTHHLAPVALLDSLAAFQPAFDDVDAIVGEIDMGQGMEGLQFKIMKFMTAPADSTLNKLYDADTYQRLCREYEALAPAPGTSLEMFNTMKPMMVVTLVSMKLGAESFPDFNPQEQLDALIQQRGKADGKKIMGLETAEFQAETLMGQPISQQADMLRELLDDPAKAMQETRELTDIYLRGDIEGMNKLSEQFNSEGGEYAEALLKKRNDAWMAQIPGIMAEQSAMIVVGALHLAGESGLVRQLQGLGYTVEPLSPVLP